MSDLRILDDLGKMLDPPHGHAPSELRQRVMEVLTTSRRSPTRWFSPVWRVAAVGGLAVALIAGVSIVSTLKIGDRQPMASAEAAQILNRAADTARQAPAVTPRADQFVFVESRTWYPTSARQSGSGLTRTWRSTDGTRDGLVWTELPNPEGRTETPIPGCRTSACQPAPAYLPELPTTPKTMLSYLTRTATGDGSADERAFTNAGTLLQTAYLTPAARTALCQAVALIPGVTALRDISDAAGRPSVAVTRTGGQGVRHEMLFDPRTYEFLGWQLQPGDGSSVNTQQLRRQAVLRFAIVDAPGQLPLP